MKKRWWVLACLGLMVVTTTPWLAPAQAPTPAPAEALEEIQFARGELAVARQALITQAMDLTPAEMEAFWPLYREYRRAAAKIGDRIVALLARYAANYENLTDPTADKLVTDFVKVEQARARLKATYLPKFKKVLPAKKVARFYQVENKLDLLILSEMAEQIPLAR